MSYGYPQQQQSYPGTNNYQPNAGTFGSTPYGAPGGPTFGGPTYGETYYEMQDPAQNKSNRSSDLYGRGRVKFIQKVYTILSMQIFITAAMAIWTMSSESFLRFQTDNIWLMILALVSLITSEIYILCCEQGRTYPTNMILLAIFTLCEAYFVSFICGLTAVTAGKQTVVIAALMTLVIVLVCTIYAFTTQTDFTTSWGIILVLSAAVLCLGIVTMFTSSPFLRNLYCALGVALFGIYLVIDTQLLMGGRSVELSVDDYVLASFCLYVDIIQIFLYIMELLRGSNND